MTQFYGIYDYAENQLVRGRLYDARHKAQRICSQLFGRRGNRFGVVPVNAVLDAE